MGLSARGLRALLGVLIIALAGPAAAEDTCGEVITLKTHGGTTTRYSLAMLPGTAAPEAALVLLPGSEGAVALDAEGCATALKGNSLVKSRSFFQSKGIVTALVDTPSDRRELREFRLSPLHAQDIGKVIADIRERVRGPVWLAGTSRGTISAANAASRLNGPAAPDGLVLTSPITSGKTGGRKSWTWQTVFDSGLGAIRMPLLVVAHADDTCPRTPPSLAGRIVALASGTREQMVTVTGGPGRVYGSYTVTCSGRAPHGFINQHAELTAGIARFIRGGKY